MPRGSGSSVLLGLYSHGWSHQIFRDEDTRRRHEAAVPCDLCGKPHKTADEEDPDSDVGKCPEHSSLATREWCALALRLGW